MRSGDASGFICFSRSPPTTIDVDAEGNVLAITFEHASKRTDVRQLTAEGIAA